jgi:ABC-type transport system substrate-binding protein
MRSDQRHAVSRRALLAASALAGLTPAFSLAETGNKGGMLNTILSPEPPVLVLGVNNQGPTIIAASKIFQGLLRFSPKLDPLPGLAKSWELSEDRIIAEERSSAAASPSSRLTVPACRYRVARRSDSWAKAAPANPPSRAAW